METYRPNRVVRMVAKILSVTYVAGWVAVALIATIVTAGELFARGQGAQKFSISVPATVELSDLRMPAVWNGGTGTVGLRKTQASLDVPFSLAPASFRLISYAGFAGLFVVMLMFLHQLRGLFRSARDGAPFDPRNTTRLRAMGILLVAGHVLATALGSWQAATVLRTIANPPVGLGLRVPLDERVIFALDEGVLLVALLLFALGEFFRRGAALEDEQSLVV